VSKYHCEENLISSVLQTGDILKVIGAGVDRRNFTVCQKEWSFIEDYYRKHMRVPTKVAFRAKFPEFVILKTTDVEHWAEEVLAEYSRTVILEAIDGALDDIEGGDTQTAVEKISDAALLVKAVEVSGVSIDGLNDTDQLYKEVLARCSNAESSDRGIAGLPTGFETIDDTTGGLQSGWLTIIGARLGEGKTWTMVRMAWEAVYSGAKVLFVTLEQSASQITTRLHSFASATVWDTTFNSYDLTRGVGVDILAYKEFLAELPELVTGEFIVADSRRGRMSPTGVNALIELHQPNIVFVDYLTLMEMQGDGDYRSIGKLTSDLKLIAEKYHLPIVVAAQINRGGVGKEPPRAEHLAGSDSIGQDSDLVITLKQQAPTVQKLRMAKFRHGPDGALWYAEYRPARGIYREVSGDKAQELIQDAYESD